MGRRRTRLVFAAAVVAVGAAAATAVAGSSAAAKPLPLRLVPNSVTFIDASHGALGTGWQFAGGSGGGTIALTSDGGRTWHVVKATPRPVVSLTVYGGSYIAKYDDGETLRSSGGGRIWRPTTMTTADIAAYLSVCPQGTTVGTNADNSNWSVCTTEPAAGNQGKAVYRDLVDRGWVRVACTDFGDPKARCSGRGHGGISSYGYPVGIAGASDGFGLIWETRGTLYVTRDGGHNWTALDKLVQPELDFGSWAFTLPGGVGWALVGHGGGPWRLLRTTDAGRGWHVVHRWAAQSR
jgi:photosystem II stability/assembly factor-like uncharacterized protein